MCTYATWTRQKGIMDFFTFKSIVDKFLPYRGNLEYVTIHGCGEPLLDPELEKKVQYLKFHDFKGTGFATNCTHLFPDRSENLILAGLDTIICSVDGYKKETHEMIRVGTDFDEIIKNIHLFIDLRNNYLKKGCKKVPRVIIRFIRQQLNYTEWDDYHSYWSSFLNTSIGDRVIYFDVHNWGDSLKKYSQQNVQLNYPKGKIICEDIFSRMIIFANGDVSFCCGDENGFFQLGNVLIDDPIAIFNNEKFRTYREEMNNGNFFNLEYCKECTIPLSRLNKLKP
ncbi:MAG: hypothetical protein GXY18_11885 [Methanomicrobiales archaeon]|nr:hypothetical protein [Methanomicrobiales archaeon]